MSGKSEAKHQAIWVCWTVPDNLPQEGEIVLSFLNPRSELNLVTSTSNHVISSRTMSQNIRAEAKRLYVDLVANIGIARKSTELTFRHTLAENRKTSAWWYHPVSFKDCETDPTFDHLIALLTIQRTAKENNADLIIMNGGPVEIASILRQRYKVIEKKPRGDSLVLHALRGLIGRLRFAIATLSQMQLIKKKFQTPHQIFDVLLISFWNSNSKWDADKHEPANTYFGRLPALLAEKRLSYGWLTQLETVPSTPLLLDNLLKNGLSNVVFLQSYLAASDVLRSILDFRPLFVFFRYRATIEHYITNKSDMNYYPLFARGLLTGFLDASIPSCYLTEKATAKAYIAHSPKVSLTCLEHFPVSRASYAGAGKSNKSIACYTVQHASYNHDKTFLSLHPSIEFKGVPDGCAVPHPKFVCTSGYLGAKLFAECGYESDQILLTGSTRYDYLEYLSQSKDEISESTVLGKGSRNVLVVSALNKDTDLDMLEAVSDAAAGISRIKIIFRVHPLSKILKDRRFSVFGENIETSDLTLQEDLRRADLVIFSYSSVAEEAFLQGKPVWQWLPRGFNGSALAEVTTIGSFNSIAELRQAFLRFIDKPDEYIPNHASRVEVLKQLYLASDGKAASRVAEHCESHLGVVRP